jgi:hypothetical protein
MIDLPEDRMPEGEVALRLAFYLLDQPHSNRHADVAIDGAMVTVSGNSIFGIGAFLAHYGWKLDERDGGNAWHGVYRKLDLSLRVHSRSGVGDVVSRIGDVLVRAECKGGPLKKRLGSPERPIVQKAIGQLMTIAEIDEGDCRVVAVPLTAEFRKLIERWRNRPLIVRAEIIFALVGRDGTVEGLEGAFSPGLSSAN